MVGKPPPRGKAKKEALTVVGCKALKRPGYHADGGKLYLRITSAGSKSWAFCYTREGKAREMGLGSFDAVSLARARERAAEARALLAEGKDPLALRQEEADQQKAEQARERANRVTFSTATALYMDTHRKEWKNLKHQQQWANTLSQYAFPVIGDLVVRLIEREHVLEVLRPIWSEKTETASRLRGRIESILSWATVEGYRAGPNPASWKGNLEHSLAAPESIMERGHHASMAYSEVPAFVAQLRGEKDATARMLEFTILTGARTKEVCGAKWDQVDFEGKVWICPASIMKMKREHRVPLTARAVEILKAQQAERVEGGEFIFPGRKPGSPVSNMAMAKLLDRMGVEEATVHGFRSSFRTWASDKTNFPREICESALAHNIAGDTENAYQRGDHLQKRRRLMDAWAGHCNTVFLGEIGKGVHLLVVNRAA